VSFNEFLCKVRDEHPRQPGQDWNEWLQQTKDRAAILWQEQQSGIVPFDITKRTVPFHMPTAYPLTHTMNRRTK
jgi:hypothetical protein